MLGFSPRVRGIFFLSLMAGTGLIAAGVTMTSRQCAAPAGIPGATEKLACEAQAEGPRTRALQPGRARTDAPSCPMPAQTESLPQSRPERKQAEADRFLAAQTFEACEKKKCDETSLRAPREERGGVAPEPARNAPRPPPSCPPVKPQDKAGQQTQPTGGEGYVNHGVNPSRRTVQETTSTFAIDVDTASYTLARRKIREGEMPNRDGVRVEEFVNYFKYSYPQPTKEQGPFAVALEAAPSPYLKDTHILRVGLQGKTITAAERKSAHLTFLVDTSGSMRRADRLPLAQKALRILVDNLEATDTVALCTYAGSVREVLQPTGLEEKAKILDAIDSLTAGGGTAMASGIELAYKLATKNVVEGSVNRIIICSDGDANVGKTRDSAIHDMIAGYVEKGITVSTIGFGVGNYKDNRMEQLANKGNGNCYYIDTIEQAKRVFQEQVQGTLQVIAKDVKVQVEFDPSIVESWRLVGYENRHIDNKDFRNDKVDAGEIGAGHSVTALYELSLKKGCLDNGGKGQLATVRVRHKTPDAKLEDKASETCFTLGTSAVRDKVKDASDDFRFAVAVAGFAEILRGSPEAEGWTVARVLETAAGSATSKEREELIELVGRADRLMAH